MAAPIAGTPVSTAYNSATSPKTATVTATAGDVLVAVAVCADSNGSDANLGVSGGGLTWTLVRQVLVSGNTNVAVWHATATTSGSVAVSFTMAGNPSAWFGGTVIPFSNATGIGSSTLANDVSSAPSVSLATTADHSAIVMAMGDWNAINGASRSYLTLAGAVTEDLYFNNTAQYTAYVAHHPDVTPQQTAQIGLSAPTGQKWAMVAVEVLGGSGAGPTHSDAPTGTEVATGSITESWSRTVTHSDAPSGAATATASMTESRALTDAPSGPETATGSIVESWGAPGNISDSPTGAATAIGSLIEAYAASVSLTGSAVPAGTVVEGNGVSIAVPSSTTAPSSRAVPSATLTLLDTPFGTATPSGSLTESSQTATGFNDTPTGASIASGSIVESWRPPFNDAPSGAQVVTGVASESWSRPDVFPDVNTVIDSFDRADGAIYAGAGSTIWDTNPIHSGSPVVNIASNAVDISTGGAECVTLAQFGPDVDFYWTIADANTIDASHYLAAFFAFQPSGASWPDTAYSGYALIGGLTATANEWSLFKYTGGSGTNIGSFGVQAVSIGDSVGISMRGSTITAYYKPAAGSWTTIGTITDATYNRAGYLGFEFGSVGIDNLTGGTHTTVGPPTFNDAPSGTATSAGVATETRATTDTATGAFAATWVLTEGLAHDNAVTGVGTAGGTDASTHTLDDAPTGPVLPDGSISEFTGAGINDAPTGAAVPGGPLDESLRVNVAPAGLATASGSIIESREYPDAPAGAAGASSSTIESWSSDATVSGAVLASGSRVESWGHGVFDSPTGPAAVSGAAVESHMRDTAVSGGASLTASADEAWTIDASLAGSATPTGSAAEFATTSTTGSPGGHILHRSVPSIRHSRSGGKIRRNT